MIITICGTPGSGKGTVGKILARKLHYKYYSMGDVRRKYALDHNMTIEELNKLAETDPSSDELVDKFQVDIGKKEDDIVVDSRLGFHFIPKSYKIFMSVDPAVGAQRIMDAHRAGENYKSLDEAMQGLRTRMDSDMKRYQALYHVNPYDTRKNGYNRVIDTSESTPEELVKTILEAMKK